MEDKHKPIVIALAGKGGVGKTSISAIIVRLLSQNYPDKKILAIDADPAIGLSTALGVDVYATVDDIRKSFVKNAENGNVSAAIEMLGEAKYQLCDSLSERGNISFLAIGRPEAAGCYCKVNAYLKEVIGMIAGAYDYIVIDGEAGIEQINRRVMEKVTHLIMISDVSKKGLQVIRTIQDVAQDLVMFEKSGVIINRVPATVERTNVFSNGLNVIEMIPEDTSMITSDMQGVSVFTLQDNTPIVAGVKEALHTMGILEKGSIT